MKQNTKTKFQFMAAIAALLIAPHAFAQSIIVQAGAVVAGNTAVIPLELVAGGGATNFDFVMNYNPTVVDESSLNDDNCETMPAFVGLTTLDCHIDTDNDQVRGIGVNLELVSLISGVFAEISLPILANAPSGESAAAFAAHFSSGNTAAPFDTTWTPKVNTNYCNINTVSGAVVSDSEHEACSLMVVDFDFLAIDGASVLISGGSEIEIMSGAEIEVGAILNADVCGQSLCQTSPDPMPNGCHSCVVQICDVEPACCDTAYSQSCLDKVNTVCGLVCN